MTTQPPDRTSARLLDEAVTRSVSGSFFDVYNELGFGYRELI